MVLSYTLLACLPKVLVDSILAISVNHAAPIFDCNIMTVVKKTEHYDVSKFLVAGFAVLPCIPSVAGNSLYHQAFGAEEALVC